MKDNKRNQRSAAALKPARNGRPNLSRSAPFLVFWLGPCLAAILVYVRSISYGFVFDDRGQIALNPQIQSWSYLPRLLTTHVWSQKSDTLTPLYRPLFSLWLLVIYSLVGATEWAWHAASIALYALTTFLVYRLAVELLQHRLAATFTALIFAVHPIHIEPVCWVSACNELLVGPLIAVSLLLFLRERRLNPKRFWSRWTLLSLFAFTAALFAKESVLPLVVVYLYLAWWSTKGARSPKQRARSIALIAAPYFAAVLLYLVIRLAAVGKVDTGSGPHTWMQVAYSAPSFFTFYLRKLVFPTGLSTFYLNPIASDSSVRMWVVTGLIAGIIALLVWLSLKSQEIGVGVILLLCPICPVIVAVKIFLDGDTAHDRYLFVPSIGLCLLIGVAIRPLFEMSAKVRAAAFAVVLIGASGFAWLTEAQQGYYRDQYAYFGRALQINPRDVLVMDYLGDAYLRDGRMAEALPLFQQAHTLAPDDPNATYCVARGLYRSGQYTDAEPLLEASTTEPGLTPFRRFRAAMLLAQDELALQHPERARSLLNDLASKEPAAADVHFMLGSIDEVEGRRADARSEYLLEYKVSGNALAGERALRLAGGRLSGQMDGASRSGSAELDSSE